MATKIRSIEGMKHGELDFEIQRGGKDVTEAVAFLATATSSKL